MSRKLGKKDRPGTPPIFSVKFSANIKYSAEHQSQKQILKKVNLCGALNFKEHSDLRQVPTPVLQQEMVTPGC